MTAALIKAGGIFCLAFAVFHLTFWRLFRWDMELQRLSSLNRAIVQALNLSLIAAFVVFGVVSLAYTHELMTTGLGRAMLWLIAVFWLLRAIQQLVLFSVQAPLSLVFFAIFVSGAALYVIPAYRLAAHG